MGSAGPRSPHVLIIGAGMGGLFLAQFLRKQNITFSIFERDASLEARKPGWAIGLSMNDDFASFMPDDVPPLRDTNHLLPLELPSQFVMYPPGGATRIGVTDSAKTPCVRANRGLLRRNMLTGVDVQWGKKLERIEEDWKNNTVTAFFEDGTSALGDLLVGCDGTHSKVREHVLGVSNTETLQPLPMAMIGGETTLEYHEPDKDGKECLLARQLRLAFSSYMSIRPSGTFFCGVDRVSPNRDSARFYWFQFMRDATYGSEDHWLRTASQEERFKKVIEYIEANEFVSEHVDIIYHGGAKDITAEYQCFYDAVLPSLPTHGGRVFLIGDAAHPTTPFRGEGAIMAIKDARQLAGLLKEAVAAGEFDSDPSVFQEKLDTLQDEIARRGAEIVFKARRAITGRAGAADPKIKPTAWGYAVQPIPPYTGPLGLQVAEK
ncbi:hypothetical protein Sste5346_005208 [Sporothrix stenoceras]|uniref:FAD-binding domain-containing protein n=1 Tax=Sporothrix stenoceras TaxID=5173 RepID=A0ABR3Z5B4_9PEZI